MKALRFDQFGPPPVLRIDEIPLPSLQKGEVLVQVKASSINPSDILTVAGRFHSQLPMTPGRDYAGIVVDGDSAWKGKAVWGTGAGFGVWRPGAHAEFVAVPSSWLSEKPDGLSMELAAVVGVPWLAAWQSLVEAGGLQKGERLLITGGSGAVGLAATQIAHWRGASVLAADIACGSENADVFIDLTKQDLVTAVRDATGGNGVDIVLDAVGGNLFSPGLHSLRDGGRQIAIANTGPDKEVALHLADFFHNDLRLIGVDTQKLTGQQIAGIMNQLREGFQGGGLRVAQPETNAFDRAIETYTKVAEKTTRKKQVLLLE